MIKWFPHNKMVSGLLFFMWFFLLSEGRRLYFLPYRIVPHFYISPSEVRALYGDSVRVRHTSGTTGYSIGAAPGAAYNRRCPGGCVYCPPVSMLQLRYPVTDRHHTCQLLEGRFSRSPGGRAFAFKRAESGTCLNKPG